MKRLFIGLLLGSSCSLWAQKADVQITIKGIKTEEGKLLIGLYNSDKEFPKGKAYRKVEVIPNKNTLTYTFKDVEKENTPLRFCMMKIVMVKWI